MVLAVACPVTATAAQSASEPALKAAYLHNFIRFTEWVGEPPGAPRVICLADATIADALEPIVRERKVDGHQLVLSRRRPADDATGCALVFMHGGDWRSSTLGASALRTRGVLTISDDQEFMRHGGAIALFVEGQRLAFAVQPQAGERAGLRFDAQFLSLARIVKESRLDQD